MAYTGNVDLKYTYWQDRADLEAGLAEINGWIMDGTLSVTEPVPRHNEIKEYLARDIIKNLA
jgi:hypothetical protein